MIEMTNNLDPMLVLALADGLYLSDLTDMQIGNTGQLDRLLSWAVACLVYFLGYRP